MRRQWTAIAAGLFALAGARASAAPPPPQSAVPPPVAQTHAECAAPTYASDQLVCSDPGLREADAAMVAVLARAGTQALVPASPGIEPQEAWLRRRSLCAMRSDHAACLRAAYADRTAVLAALAGPGATEAAGWNCPGFGTVRRAGAVWVGADADGAIVALASPPGASSWTPFVTASEKGGRLRLAPLGGKPVTCRALR
ncbi:lysozyme inhibitor LprI family protein [Novosphingobium huizhouense]|uniref:hypothetical protein n=1 Tax=Novosphingobium huizhouense TaxID=2866625 RepID=UPI001CD84821|nr:hypothetical protein [Novosphingobium huizhouense]